ncbi:hypothetical protein PHLCEN_2v7713, partial [Hermanssonia centrifuga]
RTLNNESAKAKIRRRERQDITGDRQELREELNQAPRHHKDFIPSTTTGQLHVHISRLLPPPIPEAVPADAPLDTPFLDTNLETPKDSDTAPIHTEVTVFETEPNEFGVFCRYHRKPCQDLSDESTEDSLCNAPNISTTSPSIPSSPLHSFGRTVVNGLAKAPNWFAPFLNSTVFHLVHWAYTGSNQKSTGEIKQLVHDVLLSPDFDREHLQGFRMGREGRHLDEHATSTNANFNIDDGWHEASINVPLPKERTKHNMEEQAPHLEVKGVWHRKLLDVIIAAYRDKSVRQLIFMPYEFLFQEADNPPERVYTEGYTCDALLEEDANIHAQPRHAEDGLDVKYSMVPLMLWSDSTHLANFGTASLWPIYLYFGNLSKYLRCKPSHFAAHHIAYIPSHTCTAYLWIVVTMSGGNYFPGFSLIRRIILKGRCLCPRCLVLKSCVPEMGTKYDRKCQSENMRKDTTFMQMLIAKARKLIFKSGKSITSKAVESKIYPTSLLPTRGECEHKHVKKMYAQTNKWKHEGQIAAKGHREGLLVKIKEKEKDLKSSEAQQSKDPGDVLTVSLCEPPSQPKKKRGRPKKNSFVLGPEDEDRLPETSFHAHYHISDKSTGFLPLLKDHLLSRLTGCEFDGDEHVFSDEERNSLKIIDNRLFHHKVIA